MWVIFRLFLTGIPSHHWSLPPTFQYDTPCAVNQHHTPCNGIECEADRSNLVYQMQQWRQSIELKIHKNPWLNSRFMIMGPHCTAVILMMSLDDRIDERQIRNIIYNIIPWPSTVRQSQLTSSANAWSFFLDLLERRVNNPRKEAPAFTNSRLSFFSILYIEPDEDDILIQTRFLR